MSDDAPDPQRLLATLREREELLDLAQEAGHAGIFEWQPPSGAVHLSPPFLSLYGLSDFDERYSTWQQCLYREDLTRVVNQIETAFSTRSARLRTEFRILTPTDASLRWIEARNLIFYNDNGAAIRVVAVHVDVTERKRTQAQLRAFTETLEERVRERSHALEAENKARRKAEESLRQAQKMEAVGQLTGGVAHDFNNLLTIVLGGLDAIARYSSLLEKSATAEKIARAADMALQGVHRAVSLTDRLLAFSRQQPLAPRPLNVNKLIAGVSELLRRTLSEEMSLETAADAGLWRIHADQNQLENALVNLAINARDAMPGGGKVTIETGNCFLDNEYVATLDEPVASGQYVMIAIADTGTGMTPLALSRAFEPFFTTKEVGKGTGLGLSQVYGFVRQSCGHVRIASEPGEGTTVRIYLPRYLGEEEDCGYPERTLPPGKVSGGHETILVVEDDHALRVYTTATLSELGYRVLSASGGAAALQILHRGDHFDLLFTDVVMPGGVNGRQLADEFMHFRPGLKVLFTTGYTRNAVVHEGRLDAHVQMISKPFLAGQLAARVRTVLDNP